MLFCDKKQPGFRSRYCIESPLFTIIFKIVPIFASFILQSKKHLQKGDATEPIV